MRFLINCSNLKAGGGLQVADSICCQLYRFPSHYFIVVLSSFLETTEKRMGKSDNIEVFSYNIPNSYHSIVKGRDTFMDNLVESHKIDAVLTIFGPSRWCPLVPHLSGFALPQLVIPESPFFQRMGYKERIKWFFWRAIRKWSLKRSASSFWTESNYISNRLKKTLKTENVYTVTNYYNQIFDQPESWNKGRVLKPFDGTTCLSISSPSAHKNFGIIPDIVRFLRQIRPDLKVRFVLTFECHQDKIPNDVKDNIVFLGKVDVSECPHLYQQADIMFMPTLLECFSATYPEAMRMGIPIVTTDLEFAHDLCGNAACYYSPVDAKAAAEAIIHVATDKDYAKKLVDSGYNQLKKYDNYEQRAEKLISLLENIC